MRTILCIILAVVIGVGIYSGTASRDAARSLKGIESVAAAGNKARLEEDAARKRFKEQDERRERDRRFTSSIGGN